MILKGMIAWAGIDLIISFLLPFHGLLARFFEGWISLGLVYAWPRIRMGMKGQPSGRQHGTPYLASKLRDKR